MPAPVQTLDNDHDNRPLPLRPHTILGTCEAIGEDFGLSPMWLRIPLAASVLVSPLWAVIGYLALSVLVLASRLLFPARKATVAGAEAPTAANQAESEELKLAA